MGARVGLFVVQESSGLADKFCVTFIVLVYDKDGLAIATSLFELIEVDDTKFLGILGSRDCFLQPSDGKLQQIHNTCLNFQSKILLNLQFIKP